MWSQRVHEEGRGIMCWADLGAAVLSVQGPVGDGGQISVVIIMLRGRCSPSLSQSPHPDYLRLHFSPRAKVRWPGERLKVKGNAGQAQGRRLSLAMQFDLLTYNLKFYSPSFFFLYASFCHAHSRSLTAAKPNWDRWNVLSWILIWQMFSWGKFARESQTESKRWKCLPLRTPKKKIMSLIWLFGRGTGMYVDLGHKPNMSIDTQIWIQF